MRFCSFLGPAPVQEGIEGPDESRTVPRGEGPSDSQVVFSLVLSWFFAILNISPRVSLNKLSLRKCANSIDLAEILFDILLLSRSRTRTRVIEDQLHSCARKHTMYERQSLSHEQSEFSNSLEKIRLVPSDAISDDNNVPSKKKKKKEKKRKRGALKKKSKYLITLTHESDNERQLLGQLFSGGPSPRR